MRSIPISWFTPIAKTPAWHDAAYNEIVNLAEGRAPWAIQWPRLHEFLAIVTHPRIYLPPTPLASPIDRLRRSMVGVSQFACFCWGRLKASGRSFVLHLSKAWLTDHWLTTRECSPMPRSWRARVMDGR
jgi:hypothetical protein